MDLNKKEIENILQEKREEIKKLNKNMNTIREEIQQIEKENWEILKGDRERNLKYFELKKLFKKQLKKEVIKPRFQIQKPLGGI